MRVGVAGLALVAGCGFVAAPDAPALVAHRGAAGNWPENSRAAVMGSLMAGYPALEIDLVLTADGVPVLSHDPWLSETLCTTATGDPVEGEVLIQDLTFSELTSGFVCGGVPDPENPDAEVVADTHLSLDELLDAAEDHPEVLLYLDLKFEPDGTTPSADAFADAIVSRLESFALPNEVLFSANLAEPLLAVHARSPEQTTIFAWPRFTPDTSDVGVAMTNELLSTMGLRDVLALAEEAGASGVSIPYQVLDRGVVTEARRIGQRVYVWTLNSEKLLAAYCRWPVTGLITDYPERAPCQ